MAEVPESESRETRTGRSGEDDETIPRGDAPAITRSPGKFYPLNSSRLGIDTIRRIAVAMELPSHASRADTLPMIEGKIVEMGREPRNIQVSVTVQEDSSQTIELLDGDGVLIQADVPVDPAGGGTQPMGTESGGEPEDTEGLRTQLAETRTQNENLQREVSQLTVQLNKARSRVKELWGQQCALVSDFDRQLAEYEVQLEGLRGSSHPTREPSTEREASTVVVHPIRRTTSASRWGKAPPVEPFTGEDEANRIEDWVPRFERMAPWNEWSEGDKLLQLAGHLRGRALQEWDLIGSADKGAFSVAVQSLKNRLDPGSKTLAAQDFRHTIQSSTENVAEFILRLQRKFRIAYGHESMSTDAKNALLYGQLHEGLRYDIIKAPGVSGVDSYAALCVTAKSEERRLLELEKRQQYHNKPPHPRIPPKHQQLGKPKGHGSSQQEKPKGDKRVYFNCNQPGHFSSSCPQKRTESKGNSTSKPQTQSKFSQHGTKSGGNTRQVQSVDVPSTVTPRGAGNLLDVLLSDSDSGSDSDGSVKRVRVQDRGSSAKGVTVQVHGVTAVGVVDSGSDITIIGAELFTKVALAARRHKKDFKKPDKTPRTYDGRVFTLDGRLDLDIEFGDKSLNTPVYVRKESQDQLLLSEGVCRQLGIIEYHPDVSPLKRLMKDPNGDRKVPSSENVVKVPMVRVSLVKSVTMLPHQSVEVPVRVEKCYKGDELLLVEPSEELNEFKGCSCRRSLNQSL